MSYGSIFRFGRRLAGATAIASVLFLLPDAASAAPQALGLVATQEAMPLQCDDGVCVAFLSSFCLEEERNPPESRTAYSPAEGSNIAFPHSVQVQRFVHHRFVGHHNHNARAVLIGGFHGLA